MAIFWDPTYTGDGRLRGAYVYMAMRAEGESIFAKIGSSYNPVSRLNSLIVGFSTPPELLALARLPNRDQAFECEHFLQEKLKAWNSYGEWFQFCQDDKPAFNAICRRVFDHYSNSISRVRWDPIFKRERLLALLSLHRAEHRASRKKQKFR